MQRSNLNLPWNNRRLWTPYYISARFLCSSRPIVSKPEIIIYHKGSYDSNQSNMPLLLTQHSHVFTQNSLALHSEFPSSFPKSTSTLPRILPAPRKKLFLVPHTKNSNYLTLIARAFSPRTILERYPTFLCSLSLHYFNAVLSGLHQTRSAIESHWVVQERPDDFLHWDHSITGHCANLWGFITNWFSRGLELGIKEIVIKMQRSTRRLLSQINLFHSFTDSFTLQIRIQITTCVYYIS